MPLRFGGDFSFSICELLCCVPKAIFRSVLCSVEFRCTKFRCKFSPYVIFRTSFFVSCWQKMVIVLLYSSKNANWVREVMSFPLVYWSFPVVQSLVTNSLCLDLYFLFSMNSLTSGSSENLQSAFVLEWQYFQGTRIPKTNYANHKCVVAYLLWKHWDNRSPLTYWHTFEFSPLNICNNLQIEYQLFVALGKQDKKGETLIFYQLPAGLKVLFNKEFLYLLKLSIHWR